MTDGNIQAARKKLQDAVERLLERRPWQHRDGTVYAPSLYFCLVSDLAGTQGDTRTPAKSLPPVWIDAVQLRQDIDAQVHQWVTMPGTTPWRLNILKVKSWRPQDTDKVTDMARTINGWCQSITSMLDPESRKYIKEPCPRCGRDVVWRKDSAGETVRTPALEIRANIGCSCQACGAFWEPSKYLFLCTLLGFDLPEGVLSD